ncbi:MAG TPA: hypothetical protein VGJ78_04410, partial [Vicinamibacterales bacterium]
LAVSCALWLSVGLSSTSRVLITLPLSTSVPQTFLIAGSTFAGADSVHVWAWPPNQDPIFIGASDTMKADNVTQLGTGSFSVQARNLPVGTYPIVVYVHNAETQTFDTQVFTIYMVRPCVMVATCYPFTVGLSGALEFWFISQCV